MLLLIIAGLVVFSATAVVALINGRSKEIDALNKLRERLARQVAMEALNRAKEQASRKELDELRKKMRREEEKRMQEEEKRVQEKELDGLRNRMRKEEEKRVQEAEKRVQQEEKRVQEIEKRNLERMRREALARERSDKFQAERRAGERRRQRAEEKKADEERKKLLKRQMEEVKKADEERKKLVERQMEEVMRREQERNKLLERQMKEVKRREQELKHKLEEANRFTEQERVARLEAERGNDSIRWPTRDEFDNSLRCIRYDSSDFHLAIVGRAGCGKSSLINAFRNLWNNDPSAAQTGTKDNTLEISRHQDPGNQPSRQWIVGLDTLGAGRDRMADHEYFMNQGLYVFDLIIIAIGDRLEEIDARILQNCAFFEIPTFIVRSKADMHIRNSMNEYGHGHLEDNLECYKHYRETFIHNTNIIVQEELRRHGLPLQTVYIVSRDVLQRTYHASLHTSTLHGDPASPEKNLIHECSLVKALLTAAQRRCEPGVKQNPLDWVGDRWVALQDYFTGPDTEGPAERRDFAESFYSTQKRINALEAWGEAIAMEQPGYHPASDSPRRRGGRRRGSVALMSQDQTSSNPPPNSSRGQDSGVQVSREAGSREQPTHHGPNIHKVIHPRETNAQELYDEVVEQNPGIQIMLVGLPKMLTPNVAMLTFYPSGEILRRIRAFGVWLKLVEYGDKPKPEIEKSRTETRHIGYIGIIEAGGPSVEGQRNPPNSARGGANRGKRRRRK